jgi:stage II sporulation protein D
MLLQKIKMYKSASRYILFFILLISIGGLTSFFIPIENLQIRIFTHLKINAFQAYAKHDDYKIIADGVLLNTSVGEFEFNFNLKGDSIELKQNELVLGTYKYVKFIGENTSEIKIRLLNPDRKTRTYLNNISCSVSEGYICIINEVILDNYIAGVTEAEAGAKSTLEFYKVQAILARTYALAHINKHVLEGFSLCDQVHCQAYYGKPHDQKIFIAIEATKNKVVVDENLNLIIAAFHSNSGGQTANSEDVWGAKTPYLKSIVDTFSNRMPNSKWQRRMLTDDWLTYLKLKHNFPTESEEGKNAALNFYQSNRKIYLECNSSKVPLKNIRLDLQLKSTFFNITKINNDSVLFTGRGYGHGLGMCQEGAMRMSKLGYSYISILDFYYQKIQLIDLHKLNFFKDE